MKTPSKFRFTKNGALGSTSSYVVTRISDGRVLGTVWRGRGIAGWQHRYDDQFASREAAARSLSICIDEREKAQKKSKVWVSVVHEGRSISFITEVLDSDVEKLDPKKIFHGSCAITFEGRGIIAGHLWAVEEGS